MQNKTIKRKVTIEDILILTVFFTVMLIMLFVWNNGNIDKKISFGSPTYVSDGWVDEETGNPVTEQKIILKAGEQVTISHRVDSVTEEQRYFALYNPMLHLVVRCNDEVIYEFGEYPPDVSGKEIGAVWNVFEIPKGIENGKLELAFENLGKSRIETRELELSKIITGNQNDVSVYVYSFSLPSLRMGSLVLLIAVILFLYYFLLLFYGIKESRRMMLAMAFLTLNCSMWTMSDSSGFQVLSENLSFRFILNYVSYFMIPLYMILFFREFMEVGYRILTKCVRGYCVLLMIMFALYALDIVHLQRSVWVVHIVDICCTILFAVLAVFDYQKSKGRHTYIAILGFCILLCCCIVSLVLVYSEKKADAIMVFKFGYTSYLLILCVTVVKKSFSNFKEYVMLEHYKKLAYVDQVTGGNTRLIFEEKIQEILENHSDRYWLVHLNLVNFKLINEVMGWEKGNDLIREIYEQNEKLLSSRDMQCNMGSASLAYLLHGTEDIEYLHRKCLRLKESSIKTIRAYGGQLDLQIVLSACRVEDGSGNLNSILDKALIARDNPAAVYWEDALCYVYNEECTQKILEEKLLEGRMEEALAAGEFEMYLQPKISPKDNRLYGAEALVRWNSPNGQIYPDKFIPLFEKNGKISQIDLFMFRCACELLAKWQREGKRLITISVNVSKCGVGKPDFLGEYDKILKETGAPGEYLELEFTESIAYDSCAQLEELISWVHHRNMHCSMDDFGSAYSNFHALLALDFDSIKIDRCFFYSFPEESKNYMVVKNIVNVFHAIGMTVVCEGIENEKQIKALAGMNCDLIQGYFFSKPIPVGDFETMYRQDLAMSGTNKQ